MNKYTLILLLLFVVTACNSQTIKITPPTEFDDTTYLPIDQIDYYSICVIKIDSCIPKYKITDTITILNIANSNLIGIKAKTVLKNGNSSIWSNTIKLDNIQKLEIIKLRRSF